MRCQDFSFYSFKLSLSLSVVREKQLYNLKYYYHYCNLDQYIALEIIAKHDQFKLGRSRTVFVVSSKDAILPAANLLKSNCSLDIMPCFGLRQNKDELTKIQSGFDILVLTPYRLMDYISKKAFKASSIKLVVFNETIEIFYHGFKDSVTDFVKSLPEDANVIINTKQVTDEITDLKKFAKTTNIDPFINQDEDLRLKEVSQYFINYRRQDWKARKLIEYLNAFPDDNAVIFCNTRRSVDLLAIEMQKLGMIVSTIHGDLNLEDRLTLVELFLNGATDYLISTELLAKSIKFPNVPTIINYDLASNKENLLHRIGLPPNNSIKRTVIHFILDDDRKMLKDLERFYDTYIPEMTEHVVL